MGGTASDADSPTPRLPDSPTPRLSDEEQTFLDDPVETLCAMVDDWRINWQWGDLPAAVWDLLKREGFFAMIIPKAFGGREFSAYAQSEVVRKIASRSTVAAVTVMVPSSLGPGELLIQFGSETQQHYWLPRRAMSVRAGSGSAHARKMLES